MNLMGSEPIIVLHLSDGEDINFYVSTVEIAQENSPFGAPVYGLCESFGSISYSGDVSGFGSVGSVKVQFNDAFGIFKGLLRSTDPYTLNASLWLVVNQPPQPTEKCELLRGKIMAPISWSEGERVALFDVVQYLNYIELGYEPDFAAYHLSVNANQQPWGQPFGQPLPVVMQPICQVPDIMIDRNLVFFAPYYEPGDTGQENPIYPPVNTIDDDAYVDNQDALFIGSGNLVGWPIKDLLITPALEGVGQWVDLVIPQGKIRAFGSFTTQSGRAVFSCNPTAGLFNVPWYEGITIKAQEQFYPNLPFQKDRTTYQPNVLYLTGYGVWVGYQGFTRQGELRPTVDIDTPFPIVIPSLSREPWLEGCYIFFRVVRTFSDLDGELQMNSFDLWALVTLQDGLTITIDEVMDTNGRPSNLSGVTPVFIHYAIQNKTFVPFTQDFYSRPWVSPQNNNDSRYQVLTRPDGSAYDLAFVVPRDSKINLTEWWANLWYPVSLDNETQVNDVYIEIDGKQIFLSPFTHYRIWRFDRETGFHLAQGYVGPPGIPDFVVEQIDSLDWPEKWTFVELSSGASLLLSRQGAQVKMLVTTLQNTDEKIFKYVVDAYTSHTGTANANPAKSHPCNFWLNEKVQAPEFLGRLAFEHGKAIRLGVANADMVDLLPESPPISLRLNEGSIDARSLLMEATEASDIKNKITATGSWAPGKRVLRDRPSILLHTELLESIQIHTNRIIDTLDDPEAPYLTASWTSGVEDVEPRGYNRVLYWWLNQKAHVWTTLSFTTYLDVIINNGGIVLPNTFVGLNFSLPLSHTSLSGIPLAVNPTPISDLFPNKELPNQSIGRVLDIAIDTTSWSVSMKVRLNNKIGTW